MERLTFTPYVAPEQVPPDPTVQARYDELYAARENLGRFVCSIIDCPDDVEEVLQDIYLKVWRALPKTSHTSYQWLRTIARRTCYDYLRRLKVRRAHTSMTSLEEYEDVLEDDSALSKVDTAILARERLEETLVPIPEKERAVLVLLDDKPGVYQAIGKKTGRSYSSVAKSLCRSRKRLKAAQG